LRDKEARAPQLPGNTGEAAAILDVFFDGTMMSDVNEDVIVCIEMRA
jgi:hypothetical protein